MLGGVIVGFILITVFNFSGRLALPSLRCVFLIGRSPQDCLVAASPKIHAGFHPLEPTLPLSSLLSQTAGQT